MKNIVKILGAFATMALLSCSVAAKMEVPDSNNDPRIQHKDNKVTVAVLNLDKAAYTLKVFSRQNRLLYREVLDSETLSGKILDFEKSKKGWYRIVVSCKDSTLVDQKMLLGSI